MRASRQASWYRSTRGATPAAAGLVASSCEASPAAAASSSLVCAKRLSSTSSPIPAVTTDSEGKPKYDAREWGRQLRRFLADNSLQQHEQEEFLVRRGWFEELFQGFDLLDALPSNEREEILAHQQAIKDAIEKRGPPSEEELARRQVEGVSSVLTAAKEIAVPDYQLRLPPHVLMFGSSVVGTAFKFGDVDFGTVFPCCPSLGMKINEMRDRELEKLYAEFDEVERIRQNDTDSNDTLCLAKEGSFVREHRGPQVLPLLGRATVAGMTYVSEAGYVLVHRQIQPQVLAAIYDYIMVKQVEAEREGISEVLKHNLSLMEPAVLQVANAPSECIASSIDPLMQLGAFEEDVTPIEKFSAKKVVATTTAEEGGSALEVELTEEEKADRQMKLDLLGAMHSIPNSSSKIGQVLSGLTPEAIAKRQAEKGEDIMTNKKLGTVELGTDGTHLVVHRIFRARVPIMQFSPPSEDGSHNKPQAQTLFDGLDAEQVQREDLAEKAGEGGNAVSSTLSSSPIENPIIDRLVRDDLKTVQPAKTKESTSDDSKVNLTPETFSRFFAAAESGKTSRFTKRLPAKPMQVGSTMGVTSLLDRGQTEGGDITSTNSGASAAVDEDFAKTAYFDPKTETTDEKRKRYRADAFHDARVASSFGGTFNNLPTDEEITSKRGVETAESDDSNNRMIDVESKKAAASLSRVEDAPRKKMGDGLVGSKNSAENLFQNMTSVIYRKKEHYDLSLAISGVQNSLLLRHYMERDPELRAAALMLKYWGRKRRLLNARRGWISPYALTIMFVHYYVEAQKLVAKKLEAEGKPLRGDRIYNYVCTTTVFPVLQEVSSRLLRQDRGLISTREPIHHRFFRNSKEFKEKVGVTGKLASTIGGVEVEPIAAVEDLRGKDGKLYYPASPERYGHKMFDTSLYSYDDLLTNPNAVLETVSYPLIDEPTQEEKERIWFEAVPRHMEGFFQYFSDETMFDFDRDIVDIRSELPADRREQKDVALARIRELEACTDLNEFAKLSAEFREFKIAEAAKVQDEIKCKSKHAPIFTSYTSFTPHSWRDYRYQTRDDWYNALKDEGVIQIVPGVSGVLNPYNGQKSHPTSSYFMSPGNGTVGSDESDQEKAIKTMREQAHELWRMGLPRTNERWHRLGHEMLMIRDPYELHSLGRGTEFFRAEVIREEIRGAVDMKAGGLDDVEEFLKSL